MSIDRAFRTQGTSWWEDEGINYDDVEKFDIPEDLDVMVTHTAPLQSPAPANKAVLQNWFNKDPTLEDDLKFERAFLTKICSGIWRTERSILWVYGHFHESLSSQHEDITFRQLDINEGWEHRV